MPNLKSFRSISNITFFVAIGGLISELVALTNVSTGSVLMYLITTLKFLVSGINLSLLESHFLEYINYNNHLLLNYANLTFYTLVLIGATAYYISHGKETRLIRFSFSILLFSKTLASLYYLFGPILYFQYYQQNGLSWLWWVFGIINIAFWTYISYTIVNHITSEKELSTDSTNHGNNGTINYINTPKIQRFTHLIIDLLFSILICSSAIMFFGRYLYNQNMHIVSERVTLYFVFFIAQIFYYSFFETLFGATPGKFLTESRAINCNGTSINFGKGILRTLCRRIPFEPFSFFGQKGWHDDLTNTKVVKEKRTGVAAAYYLLIIPLFIIIGFGTNFGVEKIHDYRYYKAQKEQHEQKFEQIENMLKNLKENYVLEIKEVKRDYGPSIFLKVEDVGKDMVVFAKFTINDDYSPSSYQIEKHFLIKQYTYPIVEINKSELFSCITMDYDSYKKDKRNGADIFNDGKKYEIVEIHRLFTPHLKYNGFACNNGSIDFYIKNSGASGQLLSIKNIEGVLNWQMELPTKIEVGSGYSGSILSLHANNFKPDQSFRFIFEVQDSIGGKQSYIMQGTYLNPEFNEVLDPK